MANLNDTLAVLKRQSFWIIAPLVLLLALAGWWMGRQALNEQFAAHRATIEGYKSQVNGVRAVSVHPNEQFEQGMLKLIEQRRENVRRAWQTKWERQKQQLKWPDELPQDFRNRVESLRPIERLDPKNNPSHRLPLGLRRLYGNFVKSELPRLASLMGAKWEPTRNRRSGASFSSFSGGAEPITGGRERIGFGAGDDLVDESVLVVWDPENQAQIEQRFDWGTRPPTTLEVLYAQEDLWVLQSLVNIIKETNAGVMTRSQAAVKEIRFIQIAQMVQPQSFRVVRPGPLTGEGGGSDGTVPEDAPPSNMPEVSSSSMIPGEGQLQQQVDEVEALIKNRYVDENYQPIADKQTLVASVTVAKRIPVRVRLKADQRRLNQLLVQCANAALTFEVRQCRLNPQDPSDMGTSRSERGGREAISGGGGGMNRRGPAVRQLEDYATFDRIVELYGIVYIFNPVDEAVLRGETPGLDAGGDEDLALLR